MSKLFVNIHLYLIVILVVCLAFGKTYKIRKRYLNDDSSIIHKHSYSYFYNSNTDSSEDSSDSDTSNDLILKHLKHKEVDNDKLTQAETPQQSCKSLFYECLCSYNHDIQRYFLYCNDPSLKKFPNFTHIYYLYEKNSNNSQTDLIFSILDFRGSMIRKIRRDDFKNIKFDFYKSKESILSNINLNYSSLETFFGELKKTVLPIYHLDFDNVIDIEDAAFEDFINLSLNLSLKLVLNNDVRLLDSTDLLLKIRFVNSNLQLSPKRKPFLGLKALYLNFDNMTNEFLVNSLFDRSVIAELHIENSNNFVGFIDIGENLPSGKLLKKFSISKSYKIEMLCSHSLPSFVDQESFNEINIRKCSSLKTIRAFTFYKYRHLKTLILSSNSFSQIDKNSFKSLNHLESLDLSNNPIVSLEDEVFSDLYGLRKLNLESTLIKQINQLTLKGLFSLNELKFSKSFDLKYIHESAFFDSRNTLKELHLRDTSIKAVKSVELDKSWLKDLNLSLLNLDSNVANDEFTMRDISIESQKKLMCKFLKVLSKSTLINLQRNQTCNCFIYFLYMQKEFVLFPKWEFKAPFCYRNQLKYFENGTKIFQNIIDKENECKLGEIKNFCFPTTTVSTRTTTTTTTTRRITKYKNPATSPPPKKTKYPKFNLKKFIQVFLLIAVVTAISIILTILYLRVAKKNERKKKMRKLSNNNRIRANSNSSSNQTSSTYNLPRISSKSKINRVVLPPSVMPPFTRNPSALSPVKEMKPKTLSQLNEFKSIGKNETKALLNDSQNKTATFSIGSAND